jgi:hypothetical protein
MRDSSNKAYNFDDPHTKCLKISCDILLEEKQAGNSKEATEEASNVNIL